MTYDHDERRRASTASHGDIYHLHLLIDDAWFLILKFMATYLITGGKKLHGTADVRPAKNSAVAAMCACLLTREPVVIANAPRIAEVDSMAKVLQSLGANIHWQRGDLHLQAPGRLRLGRIDREAAVRTRSVLLLLGALLSRAPRFSIPRSGGCQLGRRTVAPHLYALERLGVTVETSHFAYRVKRKPTMRGAAITMYESGDTPTENALFAAILARGTTTITLASANYQVQDLCHLLVTMGAKIEGIGTTSLTIAGVRQLHGARYHLIPDPTEAMFWISLSATTRSPLTITGCPEEFLALELLKLEKMGFSYRVIRRYRSRSGHFSLVDLKTQPGPLVALDDKIYGRPFPGLNIDNLPFFVPIATQAKGATLIHDWVYENRAIYYLEFAKLGANITLADPHRVFINGPTLLKGAEVICPPALRPATILVIGMLAAKGKSTLRNTYSIDRGYEKLSARLRQLGAEIREVQ